MKEFNDKVLPGLKEVLPTADAMLRHSTQEKKEVEQLTFIQTEHLEMRHNLMSQGSKEDIYSMDKAPVVCMFITRYNNIFWRRD